MTRTSPETPMLIANKPGSASTNEIISSGEIKQMIAIEPAKLRLRSAAIKHRSCWLVGHPTSSKFKLLWSALPSFFTAGAAIDGAYGFTELFTTNYPMTFYEQNTVRVKTHRYGSTFHQHPRSRCNHIYLLAELNALRSVRTSWLRYLTITPMLGMLWTNQPNTKSRYISQCFLSHTSCVDFR